MNNLQLGKFLAWPPENLPDIFLTEEGVTQDDFENLISLMQIKVLFLLLGIQKQIVLNCLDKIKLGYMFWTIIS